MFSIEKGVTLPEDKGGGRPNKYPFADMEVGDSFAIPVKVDQDVAARRQTIWNCARTWAKRQSNGWTFSVREHEGGLRCWRTK